HLSPLYRQSGSGQTNMRSARVRSSLRAPQQWHSWLEALVCFETFLLCMSDILPRYYVFGFTTFWRRHYIEQSRVRINNQVVCNRTNTWKVFRYFSGSGFLLAVMNRST